MGFVSPALKSHIHGDIECSDYPPIVFLHGWGGDSGVWRPLIQALDSKYPKVFIDLPGSGINVDCQIDSLDELYSQLLALIPTQCHLVGWSLGGMISAQLCYRDPSLFLSLTSIACNVKFTVSPDWPLACEAKTFANFYTSFSEGDHEATLDRFIQLQSMGDSRRKLAVKHLRENRSPLNSSQTRQFSVALRWLNDIDNRDILPLSSLPHLAILGEKDTLVPAALESELGARNYVDRCAVVENSAHAPHISQAELVAEHMELFYKSCMSVEKEQNPYIRSKKDIAKSFDLASDKYDAKAELQRDVAKQLLSNLRSPRGNICDLGCGTGFCLDNLQLSEGNVVALDFAHGMLEHCRAKLTAPTADKFSPIDNTSLICADFECLPFADNTFDGVCSSMSFQWSESLTQLFSQIKRVLKPGAWLLFSTLGPKTLNELRRSWQRVDTFVHINRFDDKRTVESALRVEGFSIDIASDELRIIEYASVYELMRDLKDIGAHNLNSGKNAGLTTRKKISQLEQAYEQFRVGGVLPATYEVYYFLARSN